MGGLCACAALCREDSCELESRLWAKRHHPLGRLCFRGLALPRGLSTLTTSLPAGEAHRGCWSRITQCALQVRSHPSTPALPQSGRPATGPPCCLQVCTQPHCLGGSPFPAHGRPRDSPRLPAEERVHPCTNRPPPILWSRKLCIPHGVAESPSARPCLEELPGTASGGIFGMQSRHPSPELQQLPIRFPLCFLSWLLTLLGHPPSAGLPPLPAPFPSPTGLRSIHSCTTCQHLHS